MALENGDAGSGRCFPIHFLILARARGPPAPRSRAGCRTGNSDPTRVLQYPVGRARRNHRRCEIADIIVTTDLSEESKRAFGPTADLARKLGTGVTLLYVVPDLQVAPHGAPLAPAVSSPELDEEVKEARPKLDELAASFPEDVEVRTEVLVSTDVAAEVANYAKENRAAFIAISTHGRSGLRRLVLGSVAEAILRHATVPVICFPMKQ